VLDPRVGHYANHDLAEYHIAMKADIGAVAVSWIDDDDPRINPLDAKGIGEIGIVGTPPPSPTPCTTPPASVCATSRSAPNELI